MDVGERVDSRAGVTPPPLLLGQFGGNGMGSPVSRREEGRAVGTGKMGGTLVCWLTFMLR